MLNIPSKQVLDSFGIKGQPVLLKGGENTSYRVGGFVLKPTENLEEAVWRAELMNSITEDCFRLPKPVKSKNNKWVENNWCAFTFLAGKEDKKRWVEKIDISRKFHKALRNVAKPDFLDKASHPWAIADRMTWNVTVMSYGEKLKPFLEPLLKLLKPIFTKDQLIHGDITGNILFDDKLPPAVIDMSAYWRPKEYATAIIIVDSIVWDNAPDNLLNMMPNDFESNQLLTRAIIWRIKTTEEFINRYKKGKIEDMKAYKHLIDLVCLRFN